QVTNGTTRPRGPGLRGLRGEGDDAGVGVDRDLELVEEVPTEETVHGSLLDVMRDHNELADPRAADLEGVERRPLHARGPRRPADLARRPLRQRHPGRLQHARTDDGPVRARVEDQLRRGAAVEGRVDDDRLSLRELDLRARA